MNNRLENHLTQLKNRGEKALIPYIMAGDPDLKTTAGIAVSMAESGADAIEIGIPFTDPVADGPVIQKAAARALSGGVKVSSVFDTVAEIRRETEIPVVLMTYYNPVFQYGLDNFAEQAAACGVDGIIVPDLPLEESQPLRDSLQKHNIACISLIAPNSGEQRIKAICNHAGGFIYCVSVTGVTGARDNIMKHLKDFTGTVKKQTNLPLAVGFGISGPESAAQVSQYCDAVVIGSALVNLIQEHSESPELTSILSRKISEIKYALTGSGGEQIANL